MEKMIDNLSPNSNKNKNSCSIYSTTNEAEGLIDYTDPDRLLPIANVGRVMKRILPPNAKISKEAKETMQECVTEFISFVTSEASYECHVDKRKTLTGDDVCRSLFTLGFDDYASGLKRYLVRYREAERKTRADNQRTRRKESTSDTGDEISREPFRFILMDKGRDLGL